MPEEISYSREAEFELNPEERIVIAKIYECNFVKRKPIWFTKLSELLKDDMTPKTLLRILNKLTDFGWFTYQGGETENGRVARLIFIYTFESPHKDWAKKIYEETK